MDYVLETNTTFVSRNVQFIENEFIDDVSPVGAVGAYNAADSWFDISVAALVPAELARPCRSRQSFPPQLCAPVAADPRARAERGRSGRPRAHGNRE